MTGSPPVQEAIQISDVGDLSTARLAARSMSTAIGFDESAVEEIALAVRELATNLVKHANGGVLRLRRTEEDGRTGIQIDSEDQGPGIVNVERAIGDDFSTSGSLGCGLGAVNRLMDEFDVTSRPGVGTRIVCKRWLRLVTDSLPTARLRPPGNTSSVIMTSRWPTFLLEWLAPVVQLAAS